ncbi:amino acid permease-associated region [Vulcanisaeta moutnovskia 768-28]|uniref:Amino acid permease-associated region n=1 Tax=Vulcanisaeta moutnovskia (strain 768-28) TaxID=985053 RepID=F0QXY4_VULM7|nr:APC family permease [Vulcanisaeta moutnovskia]ADY02470.1 amino acid permease-associated region [Vulcanisaeta moutnovskia 768-28]
MSEQPQRALRKELGLFHITMTGLIGAIGTGILFSTAKMAEMTGPAVILAWILGGIFYLFIGLTYSEIGTAYPEAGGPSRYSLYTHGRITNMINAFADLLWYLFIPPIEAIAVVYGINYFTHNLLTPTGTPTLLGAVVAAVIVLLMVPFNYFGIKTFGISNITLGTFKLILYLLVAFGIMATVFIPSNFTSLKGGFLPYGLAAMFMAIPYGMFAFGGVRVIPDFAEEMRNPHRDMPLSIILVVVGQLLVYILFSITFVGAINWSKLNVTPGDWKSLAFIRKTNPFLYLSGTYGVTWVFIITLIIAILGPFVVGYIYLGGGTRILFAMGRSRYVPDLMKFIHEKYAIPYWALITFGIIGILLALLTAPIPSIYGLIDDAVVAGYLGFLTNPVAMIVSRKQGKEPAFKLPGGLWIGLIAFIGASYIVYWSGWPAVPYAAIFVFAASLIFGAIYSVKEHLKNALWYITYIVVLTLMTYIGQTAGGPAPILKFPWDMVVVTILAIAFYTWGVFSGLPKPYTKYAPTETQ